MIFIYKIANSILFPICSSAWGQILAKEGLGILAGLFIF